MKRYFFLLSTIGALCSSGFTIDGIGYDIGLNQIKLRIPISAIKLEPGIGFMFDDAGQNGDRFDMGVSCMVLFPVWDYQKLTAHLMGGLNIYDQDVPGDPDDEIAIDFFGGLQPELAIWDHLLISTRFGLSVPMVPDLRVGTFGNGMFDLTAGMTFMITFGGSSSSSGSYTPSSSSDY